MEEAESVVGVVIFIHCEDESGEDHYLVLTEYAQPSDEKIKVHISEQLGEKADHLVKMHVESVTLTA